MKIVYSDYNNCLTNVTNSILKYFEVKPFHSTLKVLDDVLESSNYKNIVLILNDGLGSNILKRNLDENDFLIKHLRTDITAVFPPTTTASATSVITGLNPAEHCWLGWDVYVKDIDKNVTLFLNTIKDTNIPAAEYNVAHTHFPCDSVFKLINNTNKYKSYAVSPFGDVSYDFDDSDKMYSEIKRLCKMDGKKYIYTYYNEPDNSMHTLGVNNEVVKNSIRYINDSIEKLSKELEDTLIIVTADHGHVDIEWEYLDDYPTIKSLLVRDVSIEHRAVTFFVKESKLEEFETEFNKYFGNDFILLTKNEVIESKLFGTGVPNAKFESCLGQFLAISTSNKAISYCKFDTPMKGAHAGLTEDEVIVPLILIDTNKI